MRGRAGAAAVLAAALIAGWAAPAAEAAGEAAPAAEAQDARAVTFEGALRQAAAIERREASLQRSIDELRRQLERANKQLSENSYIDYFTLYEKSRRKESFDLAERDRFQLYNEMYYFMVLEMSEGERFNSLVVPRDLTEAELTASIRKLELQKKQIRPAAELAVRELFHGIANLEEQIELLAAKLELERLRLEQDPGLERRTAADTRLLELEHETTALTKRTLTRSLAIAEAALKKELGIPLKSAVAVRPAEPAAPELLPLARYEALALERRAETLSAALDEELKRRKAKLAETYIADPAAEERRETRMEAEEAAAALAEARALVAEDVANAYAAAADRRGAWVQAEERAAQARALQGIAERMADAGTGTRLAALEAAWSAEEAEVRAREAKRAYELAWHRLTAASGIGPGYAQGEGASQL